MLENTQHEEILHSKFWHIKPHERRLFQNKKGAAKLLYLLFFRWFEQHAQFPKTLDDVPKELIHFGLESFVHGVNRQALIELLKKKRTINRYKKKVLFIYLNPIAKSHLQLGVFGKY